MTVDLDAKLHNADWTKQGWDLGFTTVGELRTYLKEQGRSVASFKKLPVYQLNVNRKGMEWLKAL